MKIKKKGIHSEDFLHFKLKMENKKSLRRTPHISFQDPGSRLRQGESDTEGLKHKLTTKLSVHCDGRSMPGWVVESWL
ncbi:hypothetical protein ACET3Z_008468 [Daucus carota]